MDLGAIAIVCFVIFTISYCLVEYLISKYKARQRAKRDLEDRIRERHNRQDSNEFEELANKYEWLQIIKEIDHE